MRYFSVEQMIMDSPYYDIVILESPDDGSSRTFGDIVKDILTDKDYGHDIRVTLIKPGDDPEEFVRRVSSKVASDRSIWIGCGTEFKRIFESLPFPYRYLIFEDEIADFVRWFSDLISSKTEIKEFKNVMGQKDHIIRAYEKEKDEHLRTIRELEERIAQKDGEDAESNRRKIICALAGIGVLLGLAVSI